MTELSNWGKWGREDQAGGARGAGNRTTWTLTSRPPGPDPRPLAAYVVDTIAVSYHGNNTTHLDALSHMYFKGQIYNGYRLRERGVAILPASAAAGPTCSPSIH